jgi:hypothetical protein
MIQKVKTEDGERWALVFGEYFSLEESVSIRNGLLGVLQATACQDTLECGTEDLYYVLRLLLEMAPTHDQAYEYERFLKKTTLKS